MSGFRMQPEPEYWRSSDSREFIAMGRLKPGPTLARAQVEMTGIAQRQAEAHPKTHAGWTIHLRPLAVQVAGKTRPVLFILLGAVARSCSSLAPISPTCCCPAPPRGGRKWPCAQPSARDAAESFASCLPRRLWFSIPTCG